MGLNFIHVSKGGPSRSANFIIQNCLKCDDATDTLTDDLINRKVPIKNAVFKNSREKKYKLNSCASASCQFCDMSLVTSNFELIQAPFYVEYILSYMLRKSFMETHWTAIEETWCIYSIPSLGCYCVWQALRDTSYTFLYCCSAARSRDIMSTILVTF